MNYLEKSYQENNMEDFALDYTYNQGHYFCMNVAYYDDYYGRSEETLDALEVYKHLKEYFKGTPHE